MKLRKQNNLFQNSIILTLFFTTPSVLAQTFDYSLLIGEWSQPGMCGTKRYVYTDEGKYIGLEKLEVNSLWQTWYEGFYFVKPEINLVVIAEGMNQSGFGFRTKELTGTRYVSQESIPGENEPGAIFEYVKCPSRN